LVDVRTELLDDALQDRQLPTLGCSVQRRAANHISLVGVRTKLPDETYHDRQQPLLGGDVKWRAAIVGCLVGVRITLLDEASQRSNVTIWAAL
jgi:hypothetical protein